MARIQWRPEVNVLTVPQSCTNLLFDPEAEGGECVLEGTPAAD